VGPFLFKDSEAPGYFTGVVGCMVSRALEVSLIKGNLSHTKASQIVIILILRFIFVASNKRRDKLFAEGRAEYDPSISILEDITDWRNPSFRYITVRSSPEHRVHTSTYSSLVIASQEIVL
jgi:hypothetical protein